MEVRMSELAEKSCTACRGGTPPLTRDEAAGFVGDIPGWSLEADGTRIERGFKFKNFAGALAFVNRVGEIAEEEGHHPDVAFGWGYAKVTLYTHKIRGLHENDFIMAAKINRLDAA
jgi:4a-hydroxytetrahydrobiopterin dehydratase